MFCVQPLLMHVKQNFLRHCVLNNKGNVFCVSSTKLITDTKVICVGVTVFIRERRAINRHGAQFTCT